jgi:CDP-diglyceride synthetase
MLQRNKYWFGPKRFGIGISPKTWEGWVCVIVYCLAMLLFRRLAHPTPGALAGVGIVLTILLFAVMFAKYGSQK